MTLAEKIEQAESRTRLWALGLYEFPKTEYTEPIKNEYSNIVFMVRMFLEEWCIYHPKKLPIEITRKEYNRIYFRKYRALHSKKHSLGGSETA